MRALIQKVSRASVTVDGTVVGQIDRGLLVLTGVKRDDDEGDIRYIADKLVNLRIFEDVDGKMNKSALDVGADLLLISQFTLYADCRRGRRPSFIEAAPPEQSEPLYETLVSHVQQYGLRVATGVFGAHMDVELVNDGPVTILLNSEEKRRGR